MDSKSDPAVYIKVWFQLGKKVFDYLQQIFIIIPHKYTQFLLIALKVEAL